MQQKIEKNFFVSEIISEIFVYEIIASELVSLNCPYEQQDTFHRQPICKQAVPRFWDEEEYHQGALI